MASLLLNHLIKYTLDIRSPSHFQIWDHSIETTLLYRDTIYTKCSRVWRSTHTNNQNVIDFVFGSNLVVSILFSLLRNDLIYSFLWHINDKRIKLIESWTHFDEEWKGFEWPWPWCSKPLILNTILNEIIFVCNLFQISDNILGKINCLLWLFLIIGEHFDFFVCANKITKI